MDNPGQRLTPVLLPIDVTCGTAQVAVPARFAHGQRDRSATPPCVVCFAGLSRGVSCRDLLTKKRAPAGADGCRGSRTAVDAGQSRDSPTSPTPNAVGGFAVPRSRCLFRERFVNRCAATLPAPGDATRRTTMPLIRLQNKTTVLRAIVKRIVERLDVGT